MSTTVRIKVDIPNSGVAELNAPGGAVYQTMDDAGRRLRDATVAQITMMGAVDTGKMRQAVAWETRGRGVRGTEVRVGVDIAKTPGTVDYPFIVHQGRGPVIPRRARVLRFKVKGKIVFATRVGPASPKPYLVRALNSFRI